MRYRTLGRTGLSVSELGYGTWGIGRAGWIGANEAESLRSLQEAFAIGVNFIDTALAYGSEHLVGEALRHSPGAAYVATKVPTKNAKWPARPGVHVDAMYPADWIVECTEQSLRNLGLETIDLQQLHTWSDEWVDQGDWAEAVESLKHAGKIRFFGISINNHEASNAVRLVEAGVVDTVQVIYNLFDQSPEDELFAAVSAQNVGVIARSPFDEGSLTGNIRPDTEFPEGDFRNAYFKESRKREVWERVEAFSSDLGVSTADAANIAFRFCLTSPVVSTVIAGMRSATNVAKNAAAVEDGPLTPAQIAALRPFRWERDFYSDFYN